ncbi:MAG: LysE family translocator [Deltaproteobacteria bacterium]|nr:LysE family translocator [Deltaproteobacteria bacterium]MBN2671336.1 LysE family translocator [Deltaproteobacteria bacterium]
MNGFIDYFTAPLLVFSIIMCVTPGPNNMMLAASGANFGYRKTLPHVLGILVGMNLLFLGAASGMATLLLAVPALHWGLKIVGTLYLLYFAVKIALLRPSGASEDSLDRTAGKPLSFITAALFQFMNPKGLVICISTLGIFTAPGPDYIPSVASVMLTFSAVCICTAGIWTGMGSALKRLMTRPRFHRIFNASLATLTAGTVLMLLF